MGFDIFATSRIIAHFIINAMDQFCLLRHISHAKIIAPGHLVPFSTAVFFSHRLYMHSYIPNPVKLQSKDNVDISIFHLCQLKIYENNEYAICRGNLVKTKHMRIGNLGDINTLFISSMPIRLSFKSYYNAYLIYIFFREQELVMAFSIR